MNTFYYSASGNAFYTGDNQGGVNWPSDCLQLSDDQFTEFCSNEPPAGKMRIAGSDGYPAWADIPQPSRDELMAEAIYYKAQLIAAATSAIAPLQDAVDLDMATNNESELLLAWKKYRVAVNRVDIQAVPDIEWPAAPKAETEE